MTTLTGTHLIRIRRPFTASGFAIAIISGVLGWTAANLISAHNTLRGNAIVGTDPGETSSQTPGGPTLSPPAPGPGVIRGTVTDARSGKAIRYATITIQGPVWTRGITDRAGHFVFERLPSGAYAATAFKPGFVPLEYGQHSAYEPHAIINITPKGEERHISFALNTGGVIAGAVTDVYGEPVPDAAVRPMRYEFRSGKRTLVPVTVGSDVVRTDEKGRFRIVGVAPGEYFVSAKVNALPHTSDGDNIAESFAETYFPGAISPQQAAAVKVTEAAENVVHIAMASTRMNRVSGFVVDELGRRVVARAGIVRIVPRGEAVTVGLTQLEPDGSFKMTLNEPSGEYLMVASTNPTLDGATGPVRYGRTPLLLTGKDVSAIQIRTDLGATIHGTVIYDSDAKADGVRPLMRMFAQPLDPDGGLVGSISVPVSPDDHFVLKNVFQASYILPDFAGNSVWRLKGVFHRGIDITSSGVDVTPGQRIDDVTVVITNHSAAVFGVVRDPARHAISDAVVLVFPADESKWKDPVREPVRYVRADSEGHYSVTGLAPDRYRIVALQAFDRGFASDWGLLRKLASRGVAAELSNKEEILDIWLAGSGAGSALTQNPALNHR
jgi:hypothetical protein